MLHDKNWNNFIYFFNNRKWVVRKLLNLQRPLTLLQERSLKQNEISALRKKIEKEYDERVELEDKIMKDMQQQLTAQKAKSYTVKVTEKLRQTKKHLVSSKLFWNISCCVFVFYVKTVVIINCFFSSFFRMLLFLSAFFPFFITFCFYAVFQKNFTKSKQKAFLKRFLTHSVFINFVFNAR